jgi:glycine C-acetyltransferase
MAKQLFTFLEKETTNLQHAGLFKKELTVARAAGGSLYLGMGAAALSPNRAPMINLASNDYLGLSSHDAVKSAAIEMINQHGTGLSASRMLAGTRAMHTELELALTKLLGTEDTLLYSSRYHANTGLFDSIFDDRDWIFCDDFAHPSLADGLRLSKARVIAYKSNDIDHLEDRLKRSRAARFRVVVSDGVFPLEGRAADLPAISALAQKYEAQVFIDDSHGVGVMGARGRGTCEALGVGGEIDIVSGTLTHALGAGSGGFISGRRQIIAWLRQKSRPYLLSSAPPPPSVGAALAALRVLEADPSVLETLRAKVKVLREGLAALNYELIGRPDHPIIVLMIGQAIATQKAVNALYSRGVYATGFCHPVVPSGAARIRAQASVLHGDAELKTILAAFSEARRTIENPR